MQELLPNLATQIAYEGENVHCREADLWLNKVTLSDSASGLKQKAVFR